MKLSLSKSASKYIFAGVMVLAFALVFGPSVYANFVLTGLSGAATGGPDFEYGYGYTGTGYGFGYGYGTTALAGYGHTAATGAPTVGTPVATQTGYSVDVSTSYSAKVKLTGTGSNNSSYESSYASGSRTLTASGLTCNTAYSFTVYAIDAGGYVYSTDGTVTTTSCSSSGGSGSSVVPGTLSESQLVRYYEQIINLLKQIIAIKSGKGGKTSCVAAKPVLSTGSRGAEVKALQSFLIAKGVSSKLAAAGATGYYGQVTKSALAEYQKSMGITPASGIYGKATAAKIGCAK